MSLSGSWAELLPFWHLLTDPAKFSDANNTSITLIGFVPGL
jgi:hypothetical protein